MFVWAHDVSVSVPAHVCICTCVYAIRTGLKCSCRWGVPASTSRRAPSTPWYEIWNDCPPLGVREGAGGGGFPGRSNGFSPRDAVSAPCTGDAEVWLLRAKRPLFLLYLP